MTNISSRIFHWKPRLEKPFLSSRDSIVQAFAWAHVSGLYFVAPNDEPDLLAAKSLATYFRELRNAYEMKLAPCDVLAMGSDLTPVCHGLEKLFVEKIHPVILRQVVESISEAVLLLHLVEKHGLENCVPNQVRNFLQLCMFGNYPFAINQKGVLYTQCA